MNIINEENILKLHNPWWTTGVIYSDFVKEMRRCAFFEASKKFKNEGIRRTIILSVARRKWCLCTKNINRIYFR